MKALPQTEQHTCTHKLISRALHTCVPPHQHSPSTLLISPPRSGVSYSPACRAGSVLGNYPSQISSFGEDKHSGPVTWGQAHGVVTHSPTLATGAKPLTCFTHLVLSLTPTAAPVPTEAGNLDTPPTGPVEMLPRAVVPPAADIKTLTLLLSSCWHHQLRGTYIPSLTPAAGPASIPVTPVASI